MGQIYRCTAHSRGVIGSVRILGQRQAVVLGGGHTSASPNHRVTGAESNPTGAAEVSMGGVPSDLQFEEPQA
jgi:hypothetical protein